MKIERLRIPAILIGLGLLLGLTELAFLVSGDRALRHAGNIGRLLALVLYAAGIPLAFALLGGLAWRRRPLIAGMVVCSMVVLGLVVGSVLSYVFVGQSGSQFYTPANYFTPSYACRHFVGLLPFGLGALAWAGGIGSAGGGIAWLINRRRQHAKPATPPQSEPAARSPQG
jgi:hypothetical protein